jgi:hypothetical protein
MNAHELAISILAREPIVVTDANGLPSGITDVAAFGLASQHLAVELAARHSSYAQISDALNKHWERNGDSFTAVLSGALSVLLLQFLEPAMLALDDDPHFDLRAHAIDALRTLEGATNE